MVQAPTITSLAGFALAVISLTAGLAALLVMLSTRRFKDRILLWFGLLSSIYGVRLLAKDSLIEIAFHEPANLRIFLVAWLDFAIAIPAMLLGEEIFGKGWRSSMRWAVWITVGYAVLGIALGIVTGNPYFLPEPAQL